MKQTANILTSVRILLSLCLLPLRLTSPGFAVCYLLCGLTDIADGALARKFHAESRFGEHLDSAADLLFFGIGIVKTLCSVQIPPYLYAVAAATLLVRIATVLYAKLFKKTITLHTKLSKAVGVSVFLIPLAAIANFPDFTAVYLTAAAFLALSLSFADLIQILSKTESEKNKMMYFIENNDAKVGISDIGAELKSFVLKADGTEYMWQGHPDFWKNSSCNLFPVCGRMTDGKYTYKGKSYEMPAHGFVRNEEMKVASRSAEEIVFELLPNEKIKAMYPFDFVLQIGFRLDGKTLYQTFTVKNIGKETMYFSVGGHPGFNVPLAEGECFEDYYIEFDDVKPIKCFVMSATCFYTGKTADYPLENGNVIPLHHRLFDDDAVYLTEMSRGATLRSKKSGKSVHLSYSDMPNLGLWHSQGKDAPFVCIEPWTSVPAVDGVVDELDKKLMMESLDAGKTYENTFSISIN